MTLRQLRPVELEVEEAAAFYDGKQAGLGREFKKELREAYDAIREFPNRGVRVGDGIQRLLLTRFPYSIIYVIRGKAIVVVAVAHFSREQNYWRERLP